MSTLLIVCSVAFALTFLFATVVMGWKQRIAEAHVQEPPSFPGETPQVTVVVPARNARDTLVPLLQDLYGGSYARERLDVIVVDDGSDDGTAGPVRGMMHTWPQLHVLMSAGVGKKAAITTGVRAARSEWIILTDADARCGPLRVERMIAAGERANADLLLGPVRMEGAGLSGRIQEAEQSALLGVAAGTALEGSPVLANGANMAFRKSAFERVHGFEGDDWASGDDVFLLQRMKRAGLRIHYVLDREAVVTVVAEPDLRGFWQQRLRWAGKMRGVKGVATWLGALGLLVPWTLLAITCTMDVEAAAGQGLFRSVLLLGCAWLLWLLPILALVREADRFLGRPSSWTMNAVGLFAFSVYAPVIAVVSLFVRPKWKGRRL